MVANTKNQLLELQRNQVMTKLNIANITKDYAISLERIEQSTYITNSGHQAVRLINSNSKKEHLVTALFAFTSYAVSDFQKRYFNVKPYTVDKHTNGRYLDMHTEQTSWEYLDDKNHIHTAGDMAGTKPILTLIVLPNTKH